MVVVPQMIPEVVEEEEEAEGQGQSPLPRHWWVVVVQAQTRCRQTDRQAGRERQAQ